MLAIFRGYTAALFIVHAALLLNAAFCLAQLMVKLVATSSQGWPFGYLPGWPSRRGLAGLPTATPAPQERSTQRLWKCTKCQPQRSF